MKRLFVGSLLAAALAATAIVQPHTARADGGKAVVQQQNVQVAINIAVHCPDASQTITQASANVASVDADGASSVSVMQSNVQMARNIAVHSPGAEQSITQLAANDATVTTSSSASVNVGQSNAASGRNVVVHSSGASQSIAQGAVNTATVTTGSASQISSSVVVSQTNRAVARNRCIGHP